MKKIPSYLQQKYVGFKSNEGFTLIEVLFALTILSIIVFFMSPIFQIVLDKKESKADLQGMEWTVFCNQLKKEVRNSTNAEIISGRLILTREIGSVQYEKYQTALRRRVNSTGHEIVLQNIEVSSFSILKNAVKITVRDLSGKEYSVTAYSIVDWGKPS